jgi:hypothetical protein
MRHALPVLAFTCAVLAAGCLPTTFAPPAGAAQQVAVPFDTLERGAYSGVGVARTEVVRERAAYAALLEQVSMGRSPEAAPPAVDFAKEMVLGVFMGMRRTGGYRTEILAVEELASEVVVRYREWSPPEGAILTQAISTPYHIVKTRRSDKPVRFVAE